MKMKPVSKGKFPKMGEKSSHIPTNAKLSKGMDMCCGAGKMLKKKS